MTKSYRWLICLAALSLAGCQVDEKTETLYSYRQVGVCDGRDLGKSGFDQKKTKVCEAVLVTSLRLRVFPEIQKVTFFEEDYGNAPNENKWTEPQELRRCKIVNQDTFNCDLLVRINGKFTNTEVISGRRLSSGIYPRFWAQLHDGWIYENFLSIFDTPLVDILFLIGIPGAGIWLIFRLFGRFFQRSSRI